MSAESVTNPVPLTQTESNTARKKRAKAEAAAVSKESNNTTPGTPLEERTSAMDGEASSNESAYVKELQKQMRNVIKKINLMAKVDAIIAEFPDLSLDDLVKTRKINADQKAQALKKPALQSSLNQLEEQITQYKKIDTEYQTRMQTERDTLSTSHKSEIESLRQSLKQEAEAEARTTLRKKLLIFSQFLGAAAAKRMIEEEANTEESKAFEGALLLVYGGDDKAVDAAENLIEGTEEAVPSVEGQPLSVTYAQVKKLSVEHAPFPTDDAFAESVQDSATMTQPAAESAPAGVDDQLSDPTIAHAGLTELSDVSTAQPSTGENGIGSPTQISAGDDMANKAAGTSWDNAGATTGGEELEESFEIVPRPADEVETPAQPASSQQTSSWADESAAAAAEMPVQPADAPVTVNGAAAAPADDGFHEVERRRGGHRGHRGDGETRGRGRGRGGYRGDRGGDRGGRGGFRGERRGGGEGRGGRGRGRGQPSS